MIKLVTEDKCFFCRKKTMKRHMVCVCVCVFQYSNDAAESANNVQTEADERWRVGEKEWIKNMDKDEGMPGVVFTEKFRKERKNERKDDRKK